jgi:hypothetical protein
MCTAEQKQIEYTSSLSTEGEKSLAEVVASKSCSIYYFEEIYLPQKKYINKKSLHNFGIAQATYITKYLWNKALRHYSYKAYI